MQPIAVSMNDLKIMSEGAAILYGYLGLRTFQDYVYAEIEASGKRASEQAKSLFNEMKRGWFPVSLATVEEDIGMSPDRQLKCIKELASLGRIEHTRIGLPAKRWIKLNPDHNQPELKPKKK